MRKTIYLVAVLVILTLPSMQCQSDEILEKFAAQRNADVTVQLGEYAVMYAGVDGSLEVREDFLGVIGRIDISNPYYVPLDVPGWFQRGPTESHSIELWENENYEWLREKLDIAEPIVIDGREGLVGLGSNSQGNYPLALFRVDTTTVCFVEQSGNYDINDMKKFIKGLVVRKVSIREILEREGTL